jgi:hypothetical protein
MNEIDSISKKAKKVKKEIFSEYILPKSEIIILLVKYKNKTIGELVKSVTYHQLTELFPHFKIKYYDLKRNFHVKIKDLLL